MYRTAGALIAALGLAALGGCSTISTRETQPLVASATQVQTQLHAEALAVQQAYDAIAQRADETCRTPPRDENPEKNEIAYLCAEWKPPGPLAGTRDNDRKNARTLVSEADVGTAALVEYFTALNAVAAANDQSAEASGRIVTRLKAATGLLGGATGPFGFVAGDGFAAAFKALAQAITARQVNRTLREATEEGQATLDLYALAMRETLGACEVRRPAAVMDRLREHLARLQRQSERDPALRAAVAQVQGAMDDTTDRCGAASYPQVIAHLQNATENGAFLTTPNYAAVRVYEDLAPVLARSSAMTINQLASIHGLEPEVPAANASDVSRRTRQLERLERLREMLAPYRADAEAMRTRIAASQQWERDRLAARNQIATRLFALANAHARLAEEVRKKGGFSFSALGLGGAERAKEDEATQSEAEGSN